MLRFQTRAAAAAEGVIVTPYQSRTTNNLLFAARLLVERDTPLPADLCAAIQSRGIEVSSI
jgi:hypothetical protein